MKKVYWAILIIIPCATSLLYATVDSEVMNTNGLTDRSESIILNSIGVPILDRLNTVNIPNNNANAEQNHNVVAVTTKNDLRLISYSQLSITTELANQQRPSVSVDANGIASIAWEDYRHGNWEIYLCRINQSMQIIVPPLRVTNSSASSDHVRIDTDASGNTFLAWEEGSSVYYAKINANGAIAVAPVSVGSGKLPAISTNPDGTTGIAWEFSTTMHGTKFQLRNATGGTINTITLRSEILDTDNFCTVDNDPEGNFYIFRRERVQYSEHYFLAKVTSTGTLVMNGSWFPTTSTSKESCLAMVDTQYLWCFYVDKYNNGTTNYYSIYDSDQDLCYNLDGDSRYPSIVKNPQSSDMFMLWEINSGNSGDYDLVAATCINGIYDTHIINNQTYSTHYPSAGCFPNGTYCFAWQDNCNGNEDIYFAVMVGYCSISGFIHDIQNNGIQGVAVCASGTSSNCISQADGSFLLSVPEGWSGEVTACHPGWLFDPQSMPISEISTDLTNQNFTGRLAPPTFSPLSGLYNSPQDITFQSTAQGSIKFRYSMDSENPTYYSGNVYYDNYPILLETTTILRAVAYVEGRPGTISCAVQADYEISQDQNALISFNIYSTMDGTPAVHHVELINQNGDNPICSQVIGNSASFTYNQVANSPEGFSKISRIELKNEYNTLIGHMNFEYTRNDFDNHKIIQGVLVTHGQHLAYTPPGGSTWAYYQSNEYMVSMLIKPEPISPSRKPMILVHGIGGSYPSFGRMFIQQLNIQNTFDIWEFYYPYDQEIDLSAPLLGDAIQRVRSYGYTQNEGRVNILAHSMGGLVTRTFIQACQDPDTGINKVCMLGTPNHGSHSSFRISHRNTYPISALLNQYLVQIDPNSPAVRQMYPGSSFLANLNSQAPKPLYPSSSVANSYLVVAGTRNEFTIFLPDSVPSWEVYRPTANDDVVVSIPSASLLEYGIPLTTVPINHQGLKGTLPIDIPLLFEVMDPGFLALFFSNTYDSNSDPFGNSVGSYMTSIPADDDWASNMQISFNTNLRSRLIKADKLATSNVLKLTFDDYESAIEDLDSNRSDGRFLISASNRLRSCEETLALPVSYYFMEQKGIFIDGPPPFGIPYARYGLTGNLGAGDYTLRLYNKKSKPFKTVQNPVTVNNATTSCIHIELSPGEKALATLTNTTDCTRQSRTRDGNGRSLIEEQYFVDATIDSLIFYISAGDDSSGFANHNAHLIDPMNTVIDSTYASASPQIEFSEDINAGFAFYYVRDPLPGIWKFLHSDSLAAGSSAAYIDSPISININIADTTYAIGDQIYIEIPQPQPAIYTNPLLSILSSYTDMDAVEHQLGYITAAYDPVDSVYVGSFEPLYPGDYQLSVGFQCQLDGSTINRYSEKMIPVFGNRTPQTVYPENGAGNLPTEVTLKWMSESLADSYQLTIFDISDSISTISVAVSDTTFTVTNLEHGREYYWYVSSVNIYGASQPSDPCNFYTMLSSPILLSPVDGIMDLSQTVGLAWQPVPGASSYHLQFSDDPLFGTCYLDELQIMSAEYELNGLSNLQTYYWRVAAVDVRGESDWSDTFSFTVRNSMISFPQSIQMQEDEILTLYLAGYIDDYDPDLYEVTINGNYNIDSWVTFDRIVLTPPQDWFGDENLIITVSAYYRSGRHNLTANDARTKARDVVYQGSMLVQVQAVNDLPVLNLPNQVMFWDSEDKTLNLAPYLSDVDNTLAEIQIAAISGVNLYVNVTGHQITFIPQNGWFGLEQIELRLSNIDLRYAAQGSGNRSLTRIESDFTTYYILVSIVSATPVVTGFSASYVEVSIEWIPVVGAGGYRVLCSDSPLGFYTDVTSNGLMLDSGDRIIWHQSNQLNDMAFYKILAIKGEQRRYKTP